MILGGKEDDKTDKPHVCYGEITERQRNSQTLKVSLTLLIHLSMLAVFLFFFLRFLFYLAYSHAAI